MDIKDFDKLTSAGEILLDLFCGLLPLCLREFSEDKLTYQKNAICDSLTTPCQTKINFCHGILPLPPFFTFWGIPFHCSLYSVVWDGRGCSILVVKLSAGSRLTLGQTENRELSQELPTKGPTIYLLRGGVGDFWSSRNFFSSNLAPVVQTLDSAIHRINHCPADSVIDFPNTYPLDSDLSGG